MVYGSALGLCFGFRPSLAGSVFAAELGADAGVDDHIQQVHSQIDEREAKCEGDDAAQNHGEIPLVDGVHQQPTNAGPGED